MKIALELAAKGCGNVCPNPMVGAVIVKNDKIIGQGYHKKCGDFHAEVNAFNNATEDVRGATMYVTLEPCSHQGKTPPCADKIIEKGISKVVIGSLDPNPLVSGKGVKKLLDAGIEVEVGVLKNECLKLNEVFMKYIVSKEPFVVLKAAMSLDGKIATSSGESKWITGEEARKNVHRLRSNLSAIMVGVNTVIKDDPELTSRIENGINPVRIIVDSNLRTPSDSKIIKTADKVKTIIATVSDDSKKAEVYTKAGVNIIKVKKKNKRVDLKELMIKLGQQNIDSILLEGGSELNFSALEQGIVDKVQFYIAPKIIGGINAKGPVGGIGIAKLSEAYKIENIVAQKIGDDILIEGYIAREKG